MLNYSKCLSTERQTAAQGPQVAALSSEASVPFINVLYFHSQGSRVAPLRCDGVNGVITGTRSRYSGVSQ